MELNFLTSLKPTHVFSFIFYYTSKSFILRCSPELFEKDFCITSNCSNNSLKDSFFFHFLICYFKSTVFMMKYGVIWKSCPLLSIECAVWSSIQGRRIFISVLAQKLSKCNFFLQFQYDILQTGYENRQAYLLYQAYILSYLMSSWFNTEFSCPIYNQIYRN